MKSIECNDFGELIINETFGNEVYFQVLSIYNTGIHGADFARIEEYGLRDEDAMQCFIIVQKILKVKLIN